MKSWARSLLACWSATSTPPTTTTTVPNNAWAHLLQDIHGLRALYPEDAPLAQWADAVHSVYVQAKAFTHPSEQQRRIAQLALEQRLPSLPG